MTRRPSPQRDRSSRRFDVTLAGDANLDILLYGLPEDLPTEQELLADGIVICLGGSAMRYSGLRAAATLRSASRSGR